MNGVGQTILCRKAELQTRREQRRWCVCCNGCRGMVEDEVRIKNFAFGTKLGNIATIHEHLQIIKMYQTSVCIWWVLPPWKIDWLHQ